MIIAIHNHPQKNSGRISLRSEFFIFFYLPESESLRFLRHLNFCVDYTLLHYLYLRIIDLPAIIPRP